jgi:hypothetical protein
MGMDVYGRKPKNEKGEYFRNNVWFWHPLWDYCLKLYPNVTKQCVDGHSNSGDGLSASNAKKLAKLIKRDLENGTAQQYSDEYAQWQESLLPETCKYCDGTGIAKKDLLNSQVSSGESITLQAIGSLLNEGQKCKMCDGNGTRDNWALNYPFTIENLQEWQEFLDNCGGFNIY